MTARIHSFTVVLEENLREDDVEELVSAIGMLRNVASVVPQVAEPGHYAAESRAREEWASLLWNLAAASRDPKRFERIKALLRERGKML